MLVSHPIQYYVPIYREMESSGKIRLTVLFRTKVGIEKAYDSGFGKAVEWDVPLLGGYSSCFVSNKTKNNGFELSIIKHLFNLRPDILMVHGYDHPTNIVAIFFQNCFVALFL